MVDLEAAALGLIGRVEPVRAVDELLPIALVGQVEAGLAAFGLKQEDGVSTLVPGQLEEVVVLAEAGAVARHRLREQEHRAAVQAFAEARTSFGEFSGRVGGSLSGRDCGGEENREKQRPEDEFSDDFGCSSHFLGEK